MTVSGSDTAPRQAGRTVPAWVNWVLAVLTVPAAALVMLVATGALLSVAACSTTACPELGRSGFVFNVLFYGPVVVAAATILVSFVTAAKRWGIAVPLIGLALLGLDLAALAVVFNTG
ncbi:hypothetical protein [Mycobacterium sp. 1274756.6]|uniref:hypothetical protein n=1 Tax=Mycobacterium sp. 1274756.6 TaxID=1834076 RepID=UPI0007FF90C6|nr:hypothetical protein [Mycobacterium sp. 1274756.6]OBJ69686.1 hypothetical protein A5643_11980 [Mycobacterium sp. 1274756.6]